ncbi:MAG: DUF2752 domain-containing protein [Bacteroidales bacterium]|nr:DUF2752 domain-containing protein [Bacteroidales bacterium]
MKSKQKAGVSSYQLINIIIAGVIIAIFIYSGIFSSTQNSYPIQCVHQQLTGMSCPSCGLSRSFSEIVRLDFQAAAEWNKYGMRVFLFFFFQLIMRLSNILYLRQASHNIKALSRFDIAISSLTFLLAFWQFLEYNIRLIF